MSAAGRRAAAGGFYVLAGGRVWGPYGRERIDGFVTEGRVGAATPIGDNPEGPFQPAARHPVLSPLFGQAAAPVGRTPAPEPEVKRAPASPAPTAPAADTAIEPATGRERSLVVWAALPEHRTENFEQLLGAFGPWSGLGVGLWLVRARMGPAALRNALTRRLTQDDALLVVEAPLDQAAWFNLGGGAEPALRRLWASGESVG